MARLVSDIRDSILPLQKMSFSSPVPLSTMEAMSSLGNVNGRRRRLLPIGVVLQLMDWSALLEKLTYVQYNISAHTSIGVSCLALL